MYAVACAAGVPSEMYSALETDIAHFEEHEGPSPAVDLGPRVTSGDPEVVYDEGHVRDFVR